MIVWFLLAYSAVFAAEALYDNSLYTTATLAARYRSLPVLGGAAAAFMAKMLAAVLIGAAAGRWLENEATEDAVRILGVLTFLTMAAILWLRKPPAPGSPSRELRSGPQIALLSLVAILACELVDEGQAVAGALAARATTEPHALLAVTVVWLGATLALVTKALLTVALGAQIRQRVPERALRYTAIAVCLGMAAFTGLKSEEKSAPVPHRPPPPHRLLQLWSSSSPLSSSLSSWVSPYRCSKSASASWYC